MYYYPEPEKIPDFAEVNRITEEAFARHGAGRQHLPVTTPCTSFCTLPAVFPSGEHAGMHGAEDQRECRAPCRNPFPGLSPVMDFRTGLPVALMNAAALADIRTGAAGAVAAKHLCRKKEIVIGLIGTGRRAQNQLDAIAQEFTIREVMIWSRNEKEAELFRQANSRYDISFRNQKRTCDCDVLVTSTSSEAPVVKARWIHPGTHINAVGADAPGKQELDPSLLVLGNVIVDDRELAIRAGEINVPIKRGFFLPSDIAGTLGEVVRGEKGRTREDQITIFDSAGLGLADPALVSVVTRYGRSTGIPFIA